MKFSRDQHRWLQWLYEAKKRFGISILNYGVTSNHIHLIVRDYRGEEAIARLVQLIAGRTGQEFNRRKKRKGAFWEDRYHATAVEGDSHLVRCMVYVDLNMVRAGVVTYPSEWPFCGYNEIQNAPKRSCLIDIEELMELINVRGRGELKEAYRGWVEEALEGSALERRPEWTENIAVGRESFLRSMKERLGIRAKGRKVVGEESRFELREGIAPYFHVFGGENVDLSEKNTFFWRQTFIKSAS
jgi:REP element-mobilizing transposase RayT